MGKWDYLQGIFSKEAIQKGSFDNYISSDSRKKGTTTVDQAFLEDMEDWRDMLARNIALRNPKLSTKELNHIVQATIDRIVFLRICEDRDIESHGRLQKLLEHGGIYHELTRFFEQADDKYNSGLFHFKDEKGRGTPDHLSLSLKIDDKPLNEIIRKLYYPESPYVFSQIPSEILGQVYEKFLGKVIRLTPSHQAKVEFKPEVRKAGGVYYTPKYIVDYIVKNTLGELLKKKTPAQAKKLKILDPACGSGSFLIGAYQYLLDWYLEQYAKEASKYKKMIYKDGLDQWKLVTKEKKNILLNNIYGVDIDRQAVEVTKLSLLLKVLENENSDTLQSQMQLFHERALPDLSQNIKYGNSLIGTDFFIGKNLELFERDDMENINAFDWDGKDGFANIMKAGGFDVVIGNPPYVRQESLGDAFKSYTQSRYETYAGTADLYVYFIEKSCKLLNKDGYYSVIVANKWMRGNYGQALRQFLEKRKIYEIIDFGDLPVFQGATTYPCIIKVSNAKPKDFHVLKVSDLDGSNRNDWLSTLMKKNAYKINLSYLSPSAWSLNTEAEAKLLEKIKSAGIPLEEYTGGKIYRGILTGLNEAFVIDTETKDRLIKEDPKSKEIIKPFLEGKDIKRYGILENRKWLIFIPWHFPLHKDSSIKGVSKEAEIEFSKNYPSVYQHLLKFKRQLSNRNKVETGIRYEWYALQRCAASYYQEFEKSKIIWGNLAKEAPFSFDTSRAYVNAPGCIFITDNLYTLGCLNSKLNWYYLKSIAAGRQGGFIEAKPTYVEQIHIPQVVATKNKQMEQLVDQMLYSRKQLHFAKSDVDKKHYQQKIGIVDKQINTLVYELYGLTKEEINIIEKSH